MNKKLFIFLITIVAVVGLLAYLKYSNILLLGSENFSNQMSGTIKEMGDGFIVVDGMIKSSDKEGKRTEKKTIRFKISPKTDLKKTAMIIKITRLNKNGTTAPFTPEKKQVDGNVSELTPNATVSLIKSRQNLFKTDTATALEINYFGFEYQE